MQYTWKDCTAEGKYEYTRNDGSAWAILCDEHHAEFEASMPGSAEKVSIKRALRVWVLANGGAKKLAESM